MASDRRKSAKRNVGQNLNDLDRRVKRVERRNRSSIDAWSVTGNMLAPGSITIDKLDPALLALLRVMYTSNDDAGDSTEESSYNLYEEIETAYDFSTNAANGKNSLFFQDTEPEGTDFTVGDIWYNTTPDSDGDPGYTPWEWNGVKWAEAQFGDAAFRFLNAGKIATGTLDAAIVVRVGQFPTEFNSSRLEISGGSGTAVTSTTLTSSITTTATTMFIASFADLPATPFSLVLDGSDTSKVEFVRVTARSGLQCTILRGRTPRAHAAGATVEYKDTTTAGIKVLKNNKFSEAEWNLKTPAEQSLEQSSLPELLNINATEGSLFLGSGTETLKFNTVDSPDRLTISGQLKIGDGLESLLIGKDLVDGVNNLKKDGIQLGTQNFWYRPNNAVASNSVYFQVAGGGTKAIRVQKDGDVFIEGTVNSTAGNISGSIDLTGEVKIGTGDQSLLLGKNLGNSGFDGLRLGLVNFWYRPESVSTGGTQFQVSDGATSNPTYIKLEKGGRVTFSGLIATGTVATGPIITVNDFKFGKDVDGTKDGLKLNSGNFWYLPSTVADGQPIFNIASGGPNSTTTYISVTKGGEVLIKGYIQGGVIEGPISTTPAPGGGTMKLGVDVFDSSDGLYLNSNNYWFVPDSVSPGSPILQIGDSSSAITFTPVNGSTPSLLRVSGEIESTSGFIGGWSLSSSGLVSGAGAYAVGLISSGTQDTAIFAGFNFSVSRTGVLTASNAVLSGSITANSGTIAGWSIQTLSIESNGGSVGMSSSNAADAVSFWAGSSTPSSAPFRVQNDGDLWATNATVTGTVNATDGYFGADSANGWTINSNTLKSKSVSGKSITLDSANARIFIYDETTTPAYNSASTSFYVDNAGYFSIGNNLYYNPVGGDGLPILTVAGRIRGSIDNVAVVPKDSNQFVIQSTSVSGSGTQTVVLTTFLNHTFAVGNTVSISGLTGTVVGLNGTRTITARTANTITFTGAFGIAVSTYTGSAVTTGTVGLTISSVVLSTASGTQSAVITMSGTHAFAVGDTVIVSGLTGGGAAAEGAWVVTAKTTNTFTISGLSGTDGTYTGLSGTARVRELTMGLHPAYNGAPGGIGLRLDENNYWFINNLFRVGSPISFMSWDGATLAVTGTVNATAGNFRNTVTVGSNATLTNRITIVGGDTAANTKIYSGSGAYNNSNTPFYLDASGQFSLGTALRVSDGSLSMTGVITATSGSFTGTVTGSIFRTSATVGNGTTDGAGVLINSGGANFYNTSSTSPVTSIDAYTGILTATGANISGLITGSRGTFSGALTSSIAGTSITQRLAQTSASAVGVTELPTLEVVRGTGSSGYISLYRPQGVTQGITFFTQQTEGNTGAPAGDLGSASTAYARAAIEHGSSSGSGWEGGLRILALGSSSGITPGRILIQAQRSISNVQSRIDIRADQIWFTELGDKGVSAGLLGEDVSGANHRLVAMNVYGSFKGKLGRGPKITYGAGAPSITNALNGDLHFRY